VLFALAAAALASAPRPPDVATLKGIWATYEPALKAHAVHPLSFTDEEWEEVAAGEVARRRERLKGTDRVIGVVWVPADLDTAWIAVQDPHVSVIDGFVEEWFPGSTLEDKVVYQSIDLPWPLATRQWVIRVVNNAPLRKATDQRFWERSWDLHPARGAKAEQKRGVWLDVNDGAWIFAAAGKGTLVAYHARTVVGGIVPDEIATRWSFGKIGRMLEDVAGRVDWVREHYVGDHEPIQRPGATPIPVPAG